MSAEAKAPRVLLEARVLERRARTGQTLLSEFSLALRAGERLVLAGASGSGKTVALRALALLDPLSAGEVSWRGHAVSAHDVPRFRASVSYVPQRPSLGVRTANESIERVFALGVHRDRTYDRRVAEAWLEKLGRSPELLDRDLAHVSGGELQSLSLVRHLVIEPDVILLDEPTSALDAELAARVLGAVNAYLAEKADRAAIWVAHDASLRGQIQGRVIALVGGRILEQA